MNKHDLIFDLDGTLIDSAPAILSCMDSVIAQAGHVALLPLQTGLIGPPLKTTLALITGLQDEQALQTLAEAFKDRYDNGGLRSTQPYAGINDLLRQSSESGVRLHLATNKRMRPTLSILQLLGWQEWFTSVYTLDRIPSGYAGKSSMLEHLLRENDIDPARAAYVGDTREDGMAAAANGLHFIAADWGYGDFEGWSGAGTWSRATAPADLLVAPNREG
ncbi:MAG: HAD family hydrolase [Pseudomonadota bacterium]